MSNPYPTTGTTADWWATTTAAAWPIFTSATYPAAFKPVTEFKLLPLPPITGLQNFIAATSEEPPAPKPLPMRPRLGRLRNLPCYCGSGRKLKHCCLN